MGVEFNVLYKDAWKNDTKWRKPDLTQLKNCTNYNNFITLKDGIKKMLE